MNVHIIGNIFSQWAFFLLQYAIVMSVIIVMVLAGAIAGYDQRDKVSIAHYKLCMKLCGYIFVY